MPVVWRPPRHPVDFLPILSPQWPTVSYSMLSETWANGDPLLPGSVKLSSLHISQCEWRTLPSDTLPRLSSVLVVLSSQTAFHHHRRCLQ